MEQERSQTKKPTVCIVIGMAGSGKTTLMQQITANLFQSQTPMYVINLDPAVKNVPFGCNIDIRDTVKYKEVMKEYQLGPNGAILTSLNLFTTKYDQVMGLVEKRASQLKYILIDTPGQIEVFTWSASGQIITETMASGFPTCVIYVVDTARCVSPTTFMSNMLYACSILYKTKLPFILAFNKTDIVDHKFAIEWMTDFDKFSAAVNADQSYMSSLTRSMSLVLDEFYSNLRAVGVSSVTGKGMNDLFKAIDEATQEYHSVYLPLLQKSLQQKNERVQKNKKEDLSRLARDLNKLSVENKSKPQQKQNQNKNKKQSMENDEEDEEDDEEEEMDQ